MRNNGGASDAFDHFDILRKCIFRTDSRIVPIMKMSSCYKIATTKKLIRIILRSLFQVLNCKTTVLLVPLVDRQV